MVQEHESRVTLYKSSVNEVVERFSHLVLPEEHVDYPPYPNKQWFIFGDPAMGHGSVTKLGRGDKPSNHWRCGGIWILPEQRSNRIGIRYISACIRYMMSLMPGPTLHIYGRVWIGSRLTDHYLRLGWESGRKYKGGFMDIHKALEPCGETFHEIRNGKKFISPGIVEEGDLKWDFPEVIG